MRTPDEFREAVAAGRLRSVRGIGPKTEEQVRAALAREPEPRALLLTQARELLNGMASALGGEAAGDPRRWRDACEVLSVVCAAEDPSAVLARFAELPQIVAVIEQDERRAVGLTIEGVPVELLVAEPGMFGTALVRATGAPAYVDALEPLPAAADEEAVYRAPKSPGAHPSYARSRSAATRRRSPSWATFVATSTADTTWSDGRASVEEMGRAARERGYDYIAICDHTPAVGAVPGLTADDVRRQADEIAAANERLAPFRVLRGIECDILADGRLDLPDDVLVELDGYRRASTVANGCRGGR